jgi:hypothetical protein
MTRARDVANIDGILTTKGDIYAATAASTPARLGVGSNGDTIVADSSTATGLRYNPQNALANPVINGGMDIWQRGTSIACGTAQVYTADRWYGYRGGLAAGQTVSRQAVNDATNLPNIQYCARIQRDSGNTSTQGLNLQYSFESANSIPFAGKAVTFSFYARKGANFSFSGDSLTYNLYSGTGTDQNIGGSYTGLVTIGTLGATLTTSWQRFVLTGTMPTNSTEMAIAFGGAPTGTAGAADFFEITGVQIDLGTYTASTAPTFRRSGGTIQGELAACQRYFAKSYAQSVAPGTANGDGIPAFFQATSVANNTPYGFLQFPMTMRAAPTITCYSYNGTVTVASRVSDGVDLSANTAAATTTNQFGSWIRNLNASTFTSSQGAMFHYTASSEL